MASQDTRKDPRAKVLSLNVRYKSATVDEFIEHHSHDISKGGIFIKTPSPFPAGTLLKFEIRIKEDQPIIAGVGRVVWKREPPQSSAEKPAGMGVKFIKLDGQSRELIDRIVAERRTEGPTFEETADGNPPPSGGATQIAASEKPTLNPSDTVSGPGGGSFFPAGAPAEQPPPQERTVIKQTDEILADALKQAGLGAGADKIAANAAAAPPVTPEAHAGNAAMPQRKATLLGVGGAGGMQLPAEVQAAINAAAPAPAATPASEPPKEEKKIEAKPVVAIGGPGARDDSHRPPPEIPAMPLPEAKKTQVNIASERPKPAIESTRPAPGPASAPASSTDKRRPATPARAQPVATQSKGGGGLMWVVVVLLLGGAGFGAWYLLTKNDQGTTAPSTSAPAKTKPSPTPSESESEEPETTTTVATTTEAPSTTTTPSTSTSTSTSVATSASSAPTASTTAPAVSTTVAPPVTTTAKPPVTTVAPPVTTTVAPPVTTTAKPPVTTVAPPVTTTAAPPVTTTAAPPVTTVKPPPGKRKCGPDEDPAYNDCQ